MRTHVVCYSGGHSSALVAIEVVRRFGVEHVVLLNHDISGWVEHADVKRFKQEVADYLGVPITFANVDGLDAESLPDQFDVVVKAGAFKVGSGSELCTSRLKTEPFMRYLAANCDPRNTTIYYGFDADERARIQRRSQILGVQGWTTDFPLATWQNRTIGQTIQVGINPPMQYGYFKHANCIGCLKAGRQHWYIVYCARPKVYAKAVWAEEEIGYTIINGVSLAELAPMFERMKRAGIEATEHVPQQRFWADVKRAGIQLEQDDVTKPCECVF